MRKLFNKLKANFMDDTPKIAKYIRNTAAFISGCALAVMTTLTASNCIVPDWWNTLYPYLIGIPAAIAFTSQFFHKNQN